MSKIKFTVILSLFIDILWLTIIIPAMPDLVWYYGVSYIWITAWVTVYAIVSLFATPVLGMLSDKYWRKPIVLYSVIWSLIAYLLISFSPLFRVYMFARVVNWLTSGNIWALQSIISDISKDHKERTLNLWIFGAVFWISFIVWPAIGWWLLGYGIKAPFMMSTILCFINILCVIFWLPETNTLLDKAKKITFSIWKVFKKMFIANEKKYYILFFLINLAIMVYQTSFTLFINKRFWISGEMSWYILALFGLVMAINQGILLKVWLKKFSNRKLITISIIWMFLMYLWAFFSNSMWLIIAFVALSSIFQWTFRPVFQNMILWQHADVGTINGNMTAVMNLASIIWPIVWWYMIDLNVSPFLIVATLIAVSYIYFKKALPSHIE